MTKSGENTGDLVEEVRASTEPFVGDRLKLGWLAVGLFFGFLLLWSVLAPLSVGANAPGVIVVDGLTKPINHLEGGIITRIHARNGQRVQEGQLLLELDDTAAVATLREMEARYFTLSARRRRLQAERQDDSELEFDSLQPVILPVEKIAQILELEADLFQARKAKVGSDFGVLEEQLSAAITGVCSLQNQISRIARQVGLIQEEVDSSRELLGKGFTPKSRVLALERQQEALEIERLRLQSRLADQRAKKREIEARYNFFNSQHQSEIGAELEETNLRYEQISGQFAVAQKVYERTRVRAPTSGIVMQLVADQAAGQVVQPGALVAAIVPENAGFSVLAQLAPSDSAYIRAGLPAYVSISAFSSREIGRLQGRVSYVSPDIQRDSPGGEAYYALRIELDNADVARLGSGVLQPGMPVAVSVESAKRPAIAYLIDPLFNSFRRAFRKN